MSSSDYSSSECSYGAAVVDSGGHLIRAGFSDPEVNRGTGPYTCFPALIGRPLYATHGKDYYVGDEAFHKQGILMCSRPIQYGLVTSWDEMVGVWHQLRGEEAAAHWCWL